MNPAAKKVQGTYVILMLLSTFATAFIWGINTLFLLDAGLSNLQAFTANAFFTLGSVLFEVPTGVIADTYGRRTSYLLGAFTLMISTLLYLLMWQMSGPFIGWALSSLILGLGFTFFSGAVEAWLVDALNHAKFDGELDDVFARGQVAGGVAMLSGSVIGGMVAQFTNLGVPYIMRIVFLGLSLVVAWRYMHDTGFTPDKSMRPLAAMKEILSKSIQYGIKKRPVRWMMLIAPFTMGVGVYVFYAMQPYLLEIYGDPEAYGVAGLAASIVAGAQIAGGMSVKYIRRLFKYRSVAIGLGVLVSGLLIGLLGLTSNFYIAVSVLVFWALTFAASQPMVQSYLNKLIPSKQRATVLSFYSLLGSSGGVATQPVFGKVADIYSYSTSFFMAAGLQLLALPFALLAKSEKTPADIIKK